MSSFIILCGTISTMKPRIVNVPYLGYKTHCIVYGDIHKGTPLILMHGGPGGCIERYEVLRELSNKGIPCIFYDQLGCGFSRVPKGNTQLWTYKTYLDELENLIKFFNLKKYHLLGHSWGGLLALEYLTTRQVKGLEKVVLFSTLPSTKIWNDEHIKMIENYPNDEKKALLNEFYGKEYDKKAYKKGIKRFYNEHVGKKSDRKYIPERRRFPKTNKEIYTLMWGPSELFGTGTLKEWDTIPKLHTIKNPTLILSGKLDESTPEINKVMNQKIPNSKWVLLENSHHGGYNEEPELVISSISQFLLD